MIKGIAIIVFLLCFLSSCKDRQEEYRVDFNNTSIKYDDDFIRAIGLQKLFNYETKKHNDLREYFDTLSYERETFIVLYVSKGDYEIIVKPRNPNYLVLFTKYNIYHVNKVPYIIENWPNDIVPHRGLQ